MQLKAAKITWNFFGLVEITKICVQNLIFQYRSYPFTRQNQIH